jgi:capsule polysaccharide modification protein KpsS
MQQREFKYEKIREIKNAHANMPVIITEMSVYHNLIVTCTNSSTILIWNFEYGKLVATLTLEEDVEPTAITFINGYSVLVVADN